MLKLDSEKLAVYLKCDEIVDFEAENVAQLSEKLWSISADRMDYIKKAYEFVRDEIFHSADAREDLITCSASEVLEAGHGICFAKSHLLAALLRKQGIPTGFCYQKLILDDETAPYLTLHGLNGVYLEEYDKWIRLDARGNKASVDAQFKIDEEQLAFPVRPEKGEEDIMVIYAEPDENVVEALKVSGTRTRLWDNLPKELARN